MTVWGFKPLLVSRTTAIQRLKVKGQDTCYSVAYISQTHYYSSALALQYPQ